MTASTGPAGERSAPFAVLDLGTQCALLLLGRRGPGGALETVEDHSLHPRLGAGLAPGGELDPVAVQRTVDVLATYVRRMDLLGVPPERRRAVATEPLRRARNAADFAARVEGELGLRFAVLEPADEARLGWIGATGGQGPAFTVDVGGGSTEITGPGPADFASVPLGAVGAAERWLGGGERASLGAFEALERGVREVFEGALGPGWGGRAGGSTGSAQPWAWLIGGSANNAAGLVLGLESYDPRHGQGLVLSAGSLRTQARRLLALDLEARLDLPIEPARAAVLPAGLVCLAQALESLGAASVPAEGRLSLRGLRHGLAAEFLAPD